MSSLQNQPEKPAGKTWSLSDHIAHLRGQSQVMDKAMEEAIQAHRVQQGNTTGPVNEQQNPKIPYCRSIRKGCSHVGVVGMIICALTIVALMICAVVNVTMHHQHDNGQPNVNVKKHVEWPRQAYSYGMEPTITITAFPNTTAKVNTTEGTTTGATMTQFINSTILQTSTVGSNATITKTSSNTMVTPKSFTYFGNTTMATYNGSSSATAYSYGNGTESVTTVTEVATANVTVVISPLPFITGTAATQAITGNGSTTRTFSGVPYGNTTARNTVYHTITTTVTPLTNCSTEVSETGVPTISTDGIEAMTASVDGASQRESHSDWPPTWSASPFSQTGTDEPIETETKTLVPIVTVDETTTVYTMTGSEIITDGGQTLTLSPGDPITMTVNQPDETTIMETLNGFSTLSTAACGPKETDTVTKVVISTVYPDATSSSTASTSSSAEVTESTSTMTASSTSTETSTSIASSSPTLETVSSTLSTSTGVTTTWSTVVSGTITRTISINYNTTVTYTAIAESSTETTPCSTVTEAVTPVVSTGSVDGITNSGSSDTTSSSSGTPCTSTPVVTVTVVPSVSSSEVTSASSSTTPCTSTPTVIVTVLPTTATITTSSDDDYGIFVSTFITTITTRALHSHSISDISNSTSTTTVAPVIHPFAVNSTGEHNTTNIPLGPASPHGVVPSNFSMSSTTTTASAAHTHTTTVIPDVSKSGGAKTKTPVLGSRGNSGTDMFCVVMLVAVVSLVVTAI